MSYCNGILNFTSENTQIVVSGGGFNLTKNRNYDIDDKNLTNVAEGSDFTDAITKHDNNQDIDLNGNYIIMGSKNDFTANRNKENFRDIFESRNESFFPMEKYLDMGKNFVYTVKTLVNEINFKKF